RQITQLISREFGVLGLSAVLLSVFVSLSSSYIIMAFVFKSELSLSLLEPLLYFVVIAIILLFFGLRLISKESPGNALYALQSFE
ncbi:MAG: hypothetical protein AB8E15_07680, partial [Bdellovibrionales bacterium]